MYCGKTTTVQKDFKGVQIFYIHIRMLKGRKKEKRRRKKCQESIRKKLRQPKRFFFQKGKVQGKEEKVRKITLAKQSCV